jgi:hypothetical protein
MLLKKLLENVHEYGGQGLPSPRYHPAYPEMRTVWQIDPWLALGVFASTAVIDEVYVMFNVLT